MYPNYYLSHSANASRETDEAASHPNAAPLQQALGGEHPRIPPGPGLPESLKKALGSASPADDPHDSFKDIQLALKVLLKDKKKSASVHKVIVKPNEDGHAFRSDNPTLTDLMDLDPS